MGEFTKGIREADYFETMDCLGQGEPEEVPHKELAAAVVRMGKRARELLKKLEADHG
jgi:hypothetical protein